MPDYTPATQAVINASIIPVQREWRSKMLAAGLRAALLQCRRRNCGLDSDCIPVSDLLSIVEELEEA